MADMLLPHLDPWGLPEQLWWGLKDGWSQATGLSESRDG